MRTDDDQPWTTSRCNRLLRPISSRIATLRKELEKQPRAPGQARNAHAVSAVKSNPSSTNAAQPTKAKKPRGFEKARDPDWVPGAKTAGVNKRTYGGRVGKKATVGQPHVSESRTMLSRPGEIAFTPLIARTANRLRESPQYQGTPLRKRRRKNGPGTLTAKFEQLHKLRKLLAPERAKLVQDLSEAYRNLLKATNAVEEKSRKGVRSLMSICMNKMPEYIELNEYFAELDRDDDEEERDVCDKIYSELEQHFGTRAGQGWRPLRQIVRAHGTALLCDVFARQLLGLEALKIIVGYCFENSGWDEAEKLMWTFLPTLKAVSMPATLQTDLFAQETSYYMHMVRALVDRTGRYGFLLDQLEYMISQGLLPLEWLATECMRPLWSRIVRTFSENDHRTYANAARLLETAMFVGIGLPDDSIFEEGEVDVTLKHVKPSSRKVLREALDNTFSSLLTVLSSIALVSHTRTAKADRSSAQRITWILDSVAVGLFKRDDLRIDLELLDPSPENMQTFAVRTLWSIAASSLVHLGGCRSGQGVVSLKPTTLIRSFSWIASQYASDEVDFSSVIASLPSFISSAAQCAGRVWKDDGFDQLQRIIDALLSISGVQLPHKLWNLKRLALETCLDFAQKTNEAEHIAYARQIERSMQRNGRIVVMDSSHTSAHTPSVGGGYKWEEGIGEWVACTPFRKSYAKRPPRKPTRPLELLPTPVTSENEAGNVDLVDIESEKSFTDALGTAQSSWDGNISSTLYRPCSLSSQSSPIKQSQPTPQGSSPKRKRAASPMVVIPVKRTCLSSEESEKILVFDYIDDSSSPCSDYEPRRSRRTRKQIRALVSNSRTTRSRDSLIKDLDKRIREDDDELGLTPQRPRRTASKQNKRPARFAVRRAMYVDVHVDDESEDELSFH